MTETLLRGFKEFCKDAYGSDETVMRRLVAEGQNPDYFIISCIDSRSNPGTIFRPAPGTFLAHKAMGAIVRPYKKGTALAAALQFAVIHNNVRQIILLGHTGCGAIKALVDKIDDEEIFSFVEVAQSALTKAKAHTGKDAAYTDLLRATEEQIVLESAENLKTYPSVKKGLADGTLKISPWIFDMESGTLKEFNPQTKNFEPIADDHPKPKKKERA